MNISRLKAIRNQWSGRKYRYLPFGIRDNYHVVDVTSAQANEEHMDWAIKHGGFDKIPYDGEGEKVAVLDTGCDIDHPDLQDQLFYAQSFIHGDSSFQDEAGHGTFCIGEIVAKNDGRGVIGVAPKAKGFVGKVLYGNGKDSSLSRFEESLAYAICEASDQGCGPISMSLGSSHPSSIIGEALQYAVNNGSIPFAAAGNEGLEGSPYASYPASFNNCISIAAANKKDLPAWFTTAGKGGAPENQPELSIASLEFYWGIVPNARYAKMIGTSMACPMAAGVCALWYQAMRKKGLLGSGSEVIQQFRSWVKRVVNDTNKNGYDPELGWGVLLLEDSEVLNF